MAYSVCERELKSGSANVGERFEAKTVSSITESVHYLRFNSAVISQKELT